MKFCRLAREAHPAHQRDRTRRQSRTPRTAEVECRWDATLQPGYEEWAAKKVHEQLAKAGFRLAEMLRVVLED